MGDENLVTIKIDDKEYKVSPSKTVLEVARENGIPIPHYCYHPGLSIAGNCRMCLCKIEGMPKPQITCSTKVQDGMQVYVNHPETKKIQNSIMEFLLINHPLDCPECDQAGECKLQDYSYKYGKDHGRFEEEKVIKSTKPFGPHVRYWGCRCIVCTRCVRFLEEITGTGELAVINRGDHSEISPHKNHELNNPLAMNVIDICPVGALVSNDFLFRRRVWELKSTKSISATDSMGANIFVDSFHSKIERIRPRENMQVNEYWIPDENRLDFEFVYSENRINGCFIHSEEYSYIEVMEKLSDILKSNKTKSALYISCWQSNESMYLINKFWKENANDNIYLFHNEIKDDIKFPKFTISGDKNPNRYGANIIFGKNNDETEKLIKDIDNNKIDLLFVIGGIPNFDYNQELIKVCDKLKSIITLDTEESELSKKAEVSIATSCYFENDGTFTNHNGRVQRYNKIIEPVIPSLGEIEIIQNIDSFYKFKKLEDTKKAEQIFNELASNYKEYKNLNYELIGELGKEINK